MKRFFAGLAATAALLFAAGPSSAAIVITEVHSTGSSTAGYGRDWFELTNTGSAAVDITGWTFDDNSNSFAASVALTDVTSIAAGQSVVFMEFGGTDTPPIAYNNFKTAWFGSNVPAGFTIGGYTGSGIGLGSGGDAVNIFDAGGALITNVTFGAAPISPALPPTFDNPLGLSGAISQLSAVGVNGAFNSIADYSLTIPLKEIGSPGFAPSAVPEPSTWALMLCGMGGLGLFARRRSQR